MSREPHRAVGHRLGLRSRTTLVALFAVSVVLAFFAVLLVREARNLDRGFTAFETAEAAILINSELEQGNDPTELLMGAPDGSVVLVETAERQIFQWGSPSDIAAVGGQPFEQQRARLVDLDGGTVMLYDAPCSLGGSATCRLRVAVPDTPLTEFVGDVWWQIARVVLPVLALTVVAVPLLVGRALRIVGRLAARVDDIAETRTVHQLPVPRARDEIRDLTCTLNDMLGRLHTVHQEQRRFIADASHELRSPVTAIAITAELAERHPDRRTDDATWQQLQSEVSRLERVVVQLLEQAASDAADPAQVEPIDLLAVARSQIPAGSAERIDAVAHGSPFALATTGHAESIASNLIANALRHATDRVTVTVERHDDDNVALVIGDDGPGVSPDERELIFEPFTRLDAARSRDNGGTGLGLTIARSAARACGGDVFVVPGTNSRFVCVLPSARISGTDELAAEGAR